MTSIVPPSNNAFLVITRFARFLLCARINSYINTQLEGFNSAGASWRSRSIRTDWNEMIRAAIWWEEQLWAEGLQAPWVSQATTAMFMVAETRSSTLHHDADFNRDELFFLSGSFRSSMVWWKVIVACVSATMHKSPLKLYFFTSFLTQNNFYYFSFDASTHHITFTLGLIQT